ncbi:hypothetical protein WA026_018532 [Henosepilachna vigintioctopunctata]|uniref:Uncharacterized protein n=1 Tax=Henosepilachna vigintioctopunctata TaxID=420089 RepID=A0AAW1U9Z1_9CUCU
MQRIIGPSVRIGQILRKRAWTSGIFILLTLLPISCLEETGPVYDTSDWIPIKGENNPVSTNREQKSLDRVLNVDITSEKNNEKFAIRKSAASEHRPRKNPHIKRSPNQRPRIKLDQPYRFEGVLSPPPKKHHQVKTFPQKVQYQQGFSFQPQYQFIPPKQGQAFNQQIYQPLPPNRQIFNLNVPQNNPQYSTLPLEVQYQQIGSDPKITLNITILQSPRPSVINSELFEAVQKGHNAQQVKITPPQPEGEKESVQLLYVPLEQLQKQQNLNEGILDEAFKSLQQQKLIAKPEEASVDQNAPVALPLVAQNQQVFLEKPRYTNKIVLNNPTPQKTIEDNSQRFELISKSRGQLILQNNQKTANVPVRQQVEVHSEKQEIVEVTSKPTASDAQEQPSYIQLEHQKPQIQQISNQFLPREPEQQYTYLVKQEGQKLKDNQFQLPLNQQSDAQFLPRDNQLQQHYLVQQERHTAREPQTFQLIQQTRNQFVPRDPHAQPQYVLQQERPKSPEPQHKHTPIQKTRNQFISREPQIQQTYSVQEQLRNPSSQSSQSQYVTQNNQQSNNEHNYAIGTLRDSAQKSRLADIQRDILQQSLEVEKLQKQIQQGKSLDYKIKDMSPPPKKKKPHQPPLAVFMEGNNQGDIDAVLDVLKSAKSISVQDEIGPNSPQIFIGPSNLNTPESFAKFPLPYLSNLDNNRIQRKAQQLPFFVAPLNYREPDGYSKIPLPSPHVGSVVVNRLHFRPQGNNLEAVEESNRPVPITNYKFVNPDFSPSVGSNSNFDTNLNQYSLESSGPRESPIKQLKEQTLFQQITGFSGFPDFPQNQYFQDVSSQPELSVPVQTLEPKPNRLPSRPKERGETSRGTKKENIPFKSSDIVEEPRRDAPKKIHTENRFQEVSPEVVLKPQSVEVSSQPSLAQDFLNIYGSNDQNYNFASSTPDYGPSSQASIEEIPANIRKLNVRPGQNHLDFRSPQVQNDASFEQSITNLQNSRVRPAQEQNRENEQIIRDFEQYTIPSRSQNSRPNIPVQLTNINPNLPGLVNELQDQGESLSTTLRYETSPVISTRPPPTTTQVIIESTEAPTTTTTRRSRGRGKSRFNMRTTTTSSYRRPTSERRRPHKTSTPESRPEESYKVNSYESTDSPRIRSRVRVPNTISERVSEEPAESTPLAPQYQPITRLPDVPQNQPNYFMNFQSTIENERPVLSQSEEELQTQAPVRAVEQYHTQKVIPAAELQYQREEQLPIRQFVQPQTERPEAPRPEVTHRPIETEKPTRRRVRLRGRPKNKYSSSTRAPHTTTQASSNEQTEFYGFIRQPNFSQSSQISNHNDDEQRVHIYAPIEQQSPPVYVPVNQEAVITSSPRIDTETTLRFVGELRPKYASPSRATTAQPPETPSTHRTRMRGRVRVPGRSYEAKSTPHDSYTTERTTRLRSRGKSHFTPPRNTRDEEPSETENYPVSYLKSKESATTEGHSQFKITVDAGVEENNDQLPYSSINRGGESVPLRIATHSHSTEPTSEEEKNYIVRGAEQFPSGQLEPRREAASIGGYRDIDNFDAAESQNYRSIFNSIEGPAKVNELKSKEIQEPATMNPMSYFEREFLGMFEGEASQGSSSTTTDMAKLTSGDTTTTEVKNESEATTLSSGSTTSYPTTTAIGEDGVKEEILSTISSDSIEGGEVTSTVAPEEELKKSTSTEAPKPLKVQTPMDLFSLQTSTSTEISRETEICFKGRCVKSRKKIRRPIKILS